MKTRNTRTWKAVSVLVVLSVLIPATLFGPAAVVRAATRVYNYSGVTVSTPTQETVRDEFSLQRYDNNDGTRNWANSWVESGESDGPTLGSILITGGELRLRTSGRSTSRQVNLSGYTQATLSFSYRTSNVLTNSDCMVAEVSRDGGSSWVTLLTFCNDQSGSPSYDIGPYMSSNTTVRFRISSGYTDASDYLYVDTVQIAHSTSCAPGVMCAHASVVGRFPYQNSGDRDNFVQATNTEYQNISARTAPQWETVDPGNGKYIFAQFDMIVTENITDIIRIDLVFNGNTDSSTTEHRIYVQRTGTNWWQSLSWDFLSPGYNIPADSNTEFTRTITSNFSNYIDPNTGAITWGVYQQDNSSDDLRINYVEMVVHSNVAPVAANDSYSTPEDTPLTVAAPGVLANDSDADSNPLTAVREAGPAGGTLVLNANGSFVYTPTLNFNGVVTFTYHASDGMANSNTATVTITVTALNDAPTFTSTPVTAATEEITYTYNVSIADVDNAVAGLTITAPTRPGWLTLTNHGDGTATLTGIPTHTDIGDHPVVLQVSDGLATTTQPFTITVSAKGNYYVYLPALFKNYQGSAR